MRSNRTRNQRKQDIIESIITYLIVGVILFSSCAILCGMAVKALNHPAEQPITYEQHIARYQNGGDIG